MNDHEREERETEDIKRMLEAGDERCMKLLFEKFYRALCMYALRYPVSPEVAEDIVQTVFISLWTNKRGKPFEGSLRSYLFGAVSKAALCWVRDHGKVYFEDIESHIDDFWDDVFSQEDAEQEERLRKKLHAAVDALPEKPRLVLQSIVWQEKPYKQVAAEMGISVNTVKTYYARALQALRKSLGSNPLLLLVWLKKQKSKFYFGVDQIPK